jgi:FMN phosphatase YigB (HAD superfamily)
VFLLDVDNTLLDNDGFQADLDRYLTREFGAGHRECYWSIFERLRVERGYADYLGAIQRYGALHRHDPRLFELSAYVLDYPFADRLFPESLDVIDRLSGWGRTVILSDGDAVMQPRKVELGIVRRG